MTNNQAPTRTRDEQIVELTEILYEAGYRFQEKAKPEAERIILEAEQRGYDRRVAEEKGEPVAWALVTCDGQIINGIHQEKCIAENYRHKYNSDTIAPLYLAPQPDTRDETIREKDAEIERLREALASLENANNNLCFMRSNDTYQSMMRDGCGDLLVKLDDARRSAREALTTPQPQGGE